MRKPVTLRRFRLAALVLLGCLAAAQHAAAGVTFYTSEALWQNALGVYTIEFFPTDEAHMALAAQLAGPPGDNAQMGPQLDFLAPDLASTTVCGPFSLRAMQSGANLVHDDTEGSGLEFVADSISIGDINNHEADSFRFTFPTQAYHGFGFHLVDSTSASNESLLVMGAQGRIGRLAGTAIPSSTGNGQQFVGIVSTEPIHSVHFTEGAGADDIAIRNLHFACARLDPDADGLSNLAELRAGTDSGDPDSDGDGLLDGEEIGTGSFVQAPQNLYGGGSIDTADFDGDGDLDVLTSHRSARRTSWYRNDGAGVFSTGQLQISPSSFQYPEFAGAADMDGDGDLDVVVSGYGETSVPRGAAWYANNGAGAFGSGVTVSPYAGTTIGPSALGDLDADGDVDVATIHASYARKYANSGAGAFAYTGGSPATDAVTLADLDLDGDLEAVSAWDSTSDAIRQEGVSISTSVDAPRSVATADLDGDGDVDVASASYGDDKVAWYPNTGAGGFGAQAVVSTAADGASAVVAADLDGDGDVDLISGAQLGGGVAWYENTDGLGGFGPPQAIHATLPAVSLHAADLDGDGDLDVLAGNESATYWFEQRQLADPTDPDSDDDGMLDAFEVEEGFDAFDPADAAEDADGDGLLNLAEQDEGTDPHAADPDEDGLLDGDEIAHGTDPFDPDSDDDGHGDGAELAAGTDPLDPQSFPAAPVPALPLAGRLLLLALLPALAAATRRQCRTRGAWGERPP